MPRDMRLSFTFGAARERLRDAVQRMLAWAPERVILSHGRRIERDGSAALRSAFGWLL
jgi:hypothetical protein